MQHHRVRRVLIAGGGIGGLVAAIALQREGIAVSVFERVKELVEVGAGLTLWANVLRALHKIGLNDMLETVGKPLTRNCILSWQGEILAETPVEALTKRFGTPLVAVHRADLQVALLSALGEGVVQTGATCTGFQQDDMEVRAHLADGQEVARDLLLGADGIHSIIRAYLFGATPPRYAGYTAWRGVAQITPRQWGEQMATETWGKGRRFGLFRRVDFLERGGCVRIMVIHHHDFCNLGIALFEDLLHKERPVFLRALLGHREIPFPRQRLIGDEEVGAAFFLVAVIFPYHLSWLGRFGGNLSLTRSLPISSMQILRTEGL